MKVGDLVRRKPVEAPDGYDGVRPAGVGLVIEDLGPDISGWTSQWAVLWSEDNLPHWLMENGCSVTYESEVEIISV